MAEDLPGDGNIERLMRYWATGPGAVKIGWGTDDSFDRCVRELSRYVPESQVKGLCARLHKRATGEWPSEKPIPS